MFAMVGLAVDKAVVITKPPIKPPVVVDPETEIIQRVKAIQAEKAELATVEYSGTITEIMDARAEDVNVVCVKAKAIIADANAVLKAKGVFIGKREAIVEILEKDAEKIKIQKENAEFLRDISIVLDPKNLDPNDPNYVNDLAIYSDLQEWCIRMLKPV
jgi:hypothetical protein